MNDLAWQHTYALMLYLANVSLDDVMRELFGGEELHPVYAAEWRERWNRPRLFFFAALDYRKQRRLIAAALAAYGEEAKRAMETAEKFHAERLTCPHTADEKAALRDAGRGHLSRP